MGIASIAFDGMQCDTINSFNSSVDQCLFARTRDDCFDEEGWIDYPLLFYCGIGATSRVLPLVVSACLLIVYFLALGATAEDFMCPSLESIAKSLRLSENIAVSTRCLKVTSKKIMTFSATQGVTFLALGNGAPDIFSSIAGIRQSRPELVMGELFGGGIFVATIVAGAVLVTGNFKVMERPICRDIFFYAASCFVVWSIAYVGTIYLWEAITVLVVYVLYIVVVIVGRIIYMRQEAADNALPAIVITGCSEMQSCGHTSAASGAGSRRESVISVSKILKTSRHRLHSTSSSFNSADPLPVNDGVSRSRKEGRIHDFVSRVIPFSWTKLKHESVFSIVVTILRVPIDVILNLTVPAIDPEDANESWSQILNCLHLITGPLLIATAAGGGAVSLSGIPCLVIVAAIGLLFAVGVFFTSDPASPPVYYPIFSLLAFLVSCCWIYSLASEVVALLETVGFLLNISEAILGLTVLAWGDYKHYT